MITLHFAYLGDFDFVGGSLLSLLAKEVDIPFRRVQVRNIETVYYNREMKIKKGAS
jgi:hypothetical protein